ncbi:hypothetical protein FIM12_07190 [SAR202 cluster bacterium AD-804-J14_MRT_500m]|nr:hypothetical protein [SAR202 cluster bacterium AD-804-J14_MRT_500m]
MGPTDRMTPFSITTVPLVMGSRPVQSMMLALVRTTVSSNRIPQGSSSIVALEYSTVPDAINQVSLLICT